jgi:nicotinamidase/pyrazinamidase
LNKKIRIQNTDTLIIVDVQNDFLLGGSLAVPNAEEIIPILNNYIEIFKENQGKIFATRDWHPINHMSFEEYGGLWPPHCIRNTKGAQFHPRVNLPKNAIIISKAIESDKEAYSGFDQTTLFEELKKNGVSRVFIGGLATDYCVKNTVLDAVKLGFYTYLLLDASRGINAASGDVARAIDLMRKNGVKIIEFSALKS